MEESAKEKVTLAAPPLADKKRESFGGGWNRGKLLGKINMELNKISTDSSGPTRTATSIDGFIESREFKPSLMTSTSARSSPRLQPSMEEEMQYREVCTTSSGGALDFRPCAQQVVDTSCVDFIEQLQAEARVDSSESAQGQAIPTVSMPVSGYAASTQAHESASGVISSTDFRHSFGGGFSSLDTTGWKGTDRSELKESSDASKSLLASPSGECESVDETSSRLCGGSSGTRHRTSPATPQLRKSQQRPPSAPAGPQKKSHLRALSSSETLPAAEVFLAAAERDRSRLSPYRALSASVIAGATGSLPSPFKEHHRSPKRLSASNSMPQFRHNILHGPPERPGRPHSALGPLQTHSLQWLPGASR
jgi:hypothetical protein